MTHALALLPNILRDGQLDPAELHANLEHLKHAVGVVQSRRYYNSYLGPWRLDVDNTLTDAERSIVINNPWGTAMRHTGVTISGTITAGVTLQLYSVTTAPSGGTLTIPDPEAPGTGETSELLGEIVGTGNYESYRIDFDRIDNQPSIYVLSASGTWAFDGTVVFDLRYDRFAGVAASIALIEDWLANITTSDDADAATALNAAIADIDTALTDSEGATTGGWGFLCQSFPAATDIEDYKYIPANGQRLIAQHAYSCANSTGPPQIDHTIEDELPAVLDTCSTTGPDTGSIGYDENTLGSPDTAPSDPDDVNDDYRARQTMNSGLASNVSWAYSILWFTEA